MNRSIILLLILIYSCNNDNTREFEYYPNGSIKSIFSKMKDEEVAELLYFDSLNTKVSKRFIGDSVKSKYYIDYYNEDKYIIVEHGIFQGLAQLKLVEQTYSKDKVNLEKTVFYIPIHKSYSPGSFKVSTGKINTYTNQRLCYLDSSTLDKDRSYYYNLKIMKNQDVLY